MSISRQCAASAAPRRSGRRALRACVLTLLLGDHAMGATFTVGGDERCSFAVLQDAIDAAEASPGPDSVHVARSRTHEAQAIEIDTRQDLEIVGGFADCASGKPDGLRTVISGRGGSADPVFRIRTPGTTADIVLRHLDIVEGDEDGDGKGGGIAFRSEGGILWIDNTGILGNVAGHGGGIHAQAFGSGGLPRLDIGDNVVIAGNTARLNGGGIGVDAVTLRMVGENIFVANNVASGVPVENGTPGSQTIKGGYGGGMHFHDIVARAEVGLVGGAIYGNIARRGGAISVDVSEDALPPPFQTFCPLAFGGNSIAFYSPSAERPMRIVANRATESGGAFQMDARSDCRLLVDVGNVAILANAAPVGAIANIDSHDGLFDTDRHVGLAINPAWMFSSGLVETCVAEECSRISMNTSEDADGLGTGGALIHADTDSQVGIDAVRIDNNQGGPLLASSGKHVAIRDSLIVDNLARGHLIEMRDGAFAMAKSTVAHNLSDAAHTLSLGGRAVLSRLILWQPEQRVLAPTGASPDVRDVLANETGSLGAALRVLVANPDFVDPDDGDFHLSATSAAIDFAPAEPGFWLDLDQAPRNVDALNPDLFGPGDLGAYEAQPPQ